MSLFFDQIKNSIKYAFSDKKAIVIIGALMTITSIINKNDFIKPIWSVFTVTMFIVVGYGSYISWYTLKGSDKPPKIRNLKKLVWEGFKKSVIISIYSIGLTFFFGRMHHNLMNGNLLIGLICIIPLVLIYLCLMGGLLNRYLNKGKFTKAFNIME